MSLTTTIPLKLGTNQVSRFVSGDGVGLAWGGTGQDLSASGGATFVLAQDASHVISARALIAADIPNLAASILTTGQVALARGGTNADLSATGGTSKFLKQASVGAAITVVQPNIGDIAGGSRPMVTADTYFFYESTTSEAVAYWQGDGQCQLGRTSQAHFYVAAGTGDTYLYNPTGRFSRFYYNNVEKWRIGTTMLEGDRAALGYSLGSAFDPGTGGLALNGQLFVGAGAIKGNNGIYLLGDSAALTTGYAAIGGGNAWTQATGAMCAFYGVTAAGMPGAAAYYCGASGSQAKHVFYDKNAAAQLTINETGLTATVIAATQQNSGGRTANFSALKYYNCYLWGHTNTEYVNSIGAFNSNGEPFIAFYCYHSATSNTLARASATNVPSWIRASYLGYISLWKGNTGTVNGDITPTEVVRFGLVTPMLEADRISLGTIGSSTDPGVGGLALTNSLQFTGTGVTNTALTLIQADASAGNMRQQVPLAKAWSVWVGTGQLLGIDTNGIYPGKGIIFNNSAGVANSAQTQIYPDAANGNLLINVPSTKSLLAYVAGNQIWASDANGFKFSVGVRAIPQIKTTTYTATSADYILLGNHAATPFTINLPAATGTGQILFIKNINTANVTVDANASETIDGSLTQVLTTNQGIMIVDYATGLWAIVAAK